MGKESEEGEETRRAVSRRKLLGLAAAAAAGLALTPLTEKAHAVTGEALIIGIDNTAGLGDKTTLHTTVDNNDGFRVDNYGEGDPDYVFPWASAITGNCQGGVGVTGWSNAGFGVFGGSNTDVGVAGHSESGIGVRGWCEVAGIGVEGISHSEGGIGVKAESENGTALQVGGKGELKARVEDVLDGMGVNAALHVVNVGLTKPLYNMPRAVEGTCRDGIGVVGDGGNMGVEAWSETGIGMKGHSKDGVGVYARSETGTALQVDGKSNFNGEGNLSTKVDGGLAFFVQNTGTTVPVPGEPKPMWPIAMFGECDDGCGVFGRGGTGVQGESTATDGIGAGVFGASTKGHGVQGVSEEGIGVLAQSPRGTALKVDGISQCYAKVNIGIPFGMYGLPSAFSVYNDADWVAEKPPFAIVGYCPKGMGIGGFSEDNAAVHGNSVNNAGVYGYSDNDTGVWGWSPKGRGVYAKSETGTALQVDGKSNIEAILDEPALDIRNDGDGFHSRAIKAYSKSSNALLGITEGEFWPGLKGKPTPGGRTAVAGISKFGPGVSGLNTSAFDNPSLDYLEWYVAPDRGPVGVDGYSDTGTGVSGFSDTGVGVLAISKGSAALRVKGRSSFSTVGSGTIPAFKKSYTVNVPAGLVTDKSHISVTLTSDPNVIRENAAVSYVERDPTNNRFTINLTKAVGRETTFTYFIVEP